MTRNLAVSAFVAVFSATAHGCGIDLDFGVGQVTLLQDVCTPLSNETIMTTHCLGEDSVLITMYDDEGCTEETMSFLASGTDVAFFEGLTLSVDCVESNTCSFDSAPDQCGLLMNQDTFGNVTLLQKSGSCMDEDDGNSTEVLCRCDGSALVRSYENSDCSGQPAEYYYYNSSWDGKAEDWMFGLQCSETYDCEEYSDQASLKGGLIPYMSGIYGFIPEGSCFEDFIQIDCQSDTHALVQLYDSNDGCASEPFWSETIDTDSMGLYNATNMTIMVQCSDMCISDMSMSTTAMVTSDTTEMAGDGGDTTEMAGGATTEYGEGDDATTTADSGTTSSTTTSQSASAQTTAAPESSAMGKMTVLAMMLSLVVTVIF